MSEWKCPSPTTLVTNRRRRRRPETISRGFFFPSIRPNAYRGRADGVIVFSSHRAGSRRRLYFLWFLSSSSSYTDHWDVSCVCVCVPLRQSPLLKHTSLLYIIKIYTYTTTIEREREKGGFYRSTIIESFLIRRLRKGKNPSPPLPGFHLNRVCYEVERFFIFSYTPPART